MYELNRIDNQKKSMWRRVAVAVIAVVLAFSLAGCGSVKQEDIVGTWKCTYIDESAVDSALIEYVYVFEDDGTYSYEAYINGEGPTGYDNGTYEIQGKKLALHSSVHNEDKECKVSGEKLVNSDFEYTKVE